MEDELFEPTLSSSHVGAHCVPSLVYDSDLAFRTAPLVPPSQRHAALAVHSFHKGSTRQRCRALYRSSKRIARPYAFTDENRRLHRRGNQNDDDDDDNDSECDSSDDDGTNACESEDSSEENATRGAFTAPIIMRPSQDVGSSADSAPAPRLQFAKRAAAPFSTHRFYVPQNARATESNPEAETDATPNTGSFPTSSHGARQSYNSTFIKSYCMRHEIRCHDGCINSIHTDPRGEYLLTGSDDLTVCLYRTDAWSQIWKATTEHRANIFSAVFVPYQGQEKILTCGLDGQTLLMDVASEQTTVMAAFSGMASSIVFPSATPTTAFVAYSDGNIVRVDTRCSPASVTVNTRGGAVSANLSFGSPLPGFVSHVHALATHERHPYTLASATDSSFVFFHDIRVGSARAYAAMGLGRLRSHTLHDVDDGIGGISFNKRGDWLAVNYRGDDVYLLPWEHELHHGPLRADPCDRTREESTDAFTSRPAAATSDSQYILSMEASGAQSIPLVLSRRYIALRGRRNSYTMFKEVAWMEDDAVVATGSDDGEVYFWSTESGALLHHTRGDGDVVNGVLCPPGSGQLITCGIDASFKVLAPDAQYLAQPPPSTAAWTLVRQTVRHDTLQATATAATAHHANNTHGSETEAEVTVAPSATTATVPDTTAAPPPQPQPQPQQQHPERAGRTTTTSTSDADPVRFSATQVFENLIMPFLSPLVVSDSTSEVGSPMGLATPGSSSLTPTPATVPTPQHTRWPSSTAAVSGGAQTPHARPASEASQPPTEEAAPPPAPQGPTPTTTTTTAPAAAAAHPPAEDDEASSWSTLGSDSEASDSSATTSTTTSITSSNTGGATSAAAVSSNPFFSSSRTAAAVEEGGDGVARAAPMRIPHLHVPAVSQLRQRVLEKVCELQSAALRTVGRATTTSQLHEVLTRIQRCRADAEAFQSSFVDWDWDEGSELTDDGDADGEDGAEEEEEASESAEVRAPQPVRPRHADTVPARASAAAGAAVSAATNSASDEWEDVRNASSESPAGSPATSRSSGSSASSSSSSSGDWDGLLAPVELLMGLSESVTRDRARHQDLRRGVDSRTAAGRGATTTTTTAIAGPSAAAAAAAAREEAETVAEEQREKRARAAEVLATSAHLHKILVHLMCAWYYYDPLTHSRRRVQYCVWHHSLLDRGNANYHQAALSRRIRELKEGIAAEEEQRRTSATSAEAPASPDTLAQPFAQLLEQYNSDVEMIFALPAPQRATTTTSTTSAARQAPLESLPTTSDSTDPSDSSPASPLFVPAAERLSDAASPTSQMQSVRLIAAEFSICAAKIHHLLQLETIYLQGKEALFYTPALRRHYWTKRAALQLQWIYYCMAMGDLNGVRRHADELDTWWEYASIVALGSASQRFLSTHAEELAHGGVIQLRGGAAAAGTRDGVGAVTTPRSEGSQCHGSTSSHANTPRPRKRSRLSDDDGDAPVEDGDADAHVTALTHGLHSETRGAKPRTLLVTPQSWRLVPAVHSHNAAEAEANTKEEPAAVSAWLPKLLAPLALRYRAVNQRLANRSVMFLDDLHMPVQTCVQHRTELEEERRLIRQELEQRMRHHPHLKMVKKIRTMLAESIVSL